jgi:photosystem II stability/assembly factor-like uncharacterized protein
MPARIGVPVFSDTQANLNSIHFFDGIKGWIVGDGGTVLRTINGGASWGKGITNVTEDLLSVNFVNDKLGFAVGANGMVLRTESGWGLLGTV